MQYKETIGDLKARVAAKTGVPVEKQQVRRAQARPRGARDRSRDRPQLFWHCKELVSELYDHLTLAQMDIHTGFGVSGYDLVRRAALARWCSTRLSCCAAPRARRPTTARPSSARRAG